MEWSLEDGKESYDKKMMWSGEGKLREQFRIIN